MSFLDYITGPPIWTAAAVYLERERRLSEDLRTLGPRPEWWRPWARRRHDRAARWFKKVHVGNLRAMLDEPDLKKRAIIAHLIGWKPPA